MRILSIAGKNLASLAKPFVVDLQAKPLSVTGLFAILGPTGSGKSTILDALCLALYGTTPRSEKAGHAQIPSDSAKVWSASDARHIARRGCTEAYARVRFEVRGVEYESEWRVGVNSKGADEGQLKTPTIVLRCLSKPASEGVLARAITEHRIQVAAITGLDFKNFCQSVLLAQGEFAAFLQSNVADRARVLESVTDPKGVYRELSKRANAKARDAGETFKNLRTAIGACTVLSEAALATLEGDRNTLKLRLENLASALATVRSQRAVWGSIAAARADLATKETALHAACEAFLLDEPARAQVLNVERVRPLGPPRESWVARQRELAVVDDTLARDNLDLAAKRSAYDAAEAAFAQAGHILVDRETTFANATSSLDRAKHADLELERLSRSLTELRNELAAVEPRQIALDKENAELLAATNVTAAERLDVERWRREHPEAAQLAATFGSWSVLLDQLTARLHEHDTAATSLSATASTEAAARSAHEASTAAYAEAERSQGQAIRSFEAARTHAFACRGRFSVERAFAVKGRQSLAETLLRLASEVLAEREVQRRAERELGEAEAAVAAGEQGKLDAESVKSARLLERISLERAHGEAQARKGLDEHRALLKDGDACPLCGALDHPFATDGSGASVDTLAEALENISKEYAAAELAYLEVCEHLVSAKAARLAHERSRAQSETTLHAREAEWNARRHEIRGLPEASALMGVPAAATEALARAVEELAQLDADESAATLANADEQRAKGAADKASIELAIARDSERERGADLQRAEAARNELDAALKRSRDDIDELWAKVEPSLAGVDHARERMVANATQTLADWVALARAFDTSSTTLAALTSREHENEVVRARIAAEAVAAHSDRERILLRAKTLASEVLAVQSERGALFDGAPVAEVEAAFRAAVADAKTTRAKADAAVDAARSAWDGVTATVRERLVQRDSLAVQCTRLAEEYEAARATLDVSEPEVARLLAVSDAELEAHRKALQTSSETQTLAEARVADARADVEGLEGARPSDDDATLEEREASLTLEHTGAARQDGELVERTRVHEAALATRQRLEKELAALDKSEGVWAQLAELIGHNEGDKFANFAQGLSFDALLKAANTQLRRLRPRYALAHIPNVGNRGTDLDFAVVDNDFGAQIRPISTLSGGERFLVALALALGLSKLASRHTPIGTLFIDEGFGTLDAETLDLAMGVLDSLQEGGTKVGIISHVGIFSSQIPVQVRVECLNGVSSEVRVVG